jgi:hypothetical protein
MGTCVAMPKTDDVIAEMNRRPELSVRRLPGRQLLDAITGRRHVVGIDWHAA